MRSTVLPVRFDSSTQGNEKAVADSDNHTYQTRNQHASLLLAAQHLLRSAASLHGHADFVCAGQYHRQRCLVSQSPRSPPEQQPFKTVLFQIANSFSSAAEPAEGIPDVRHVC